MTKTAIAEAFRTLSTDDKLDLLYQLSDEIALELESRPPSEAERRFLEERLRDVETDTRPDRPWPEFRDDIRKA